jgi:hypothetical protein
MSRDKFSELLEISLNNKYLPIFNYSEKHSLKIKGNPEQVMNGIQNLKIHDDFFIKLAIAIRELPNKICSKSKEQKPPFSLENFTLLEKSNTQIAFGLIGQFWKNDYGQVKFESSANFLEFEKLDYVKLVLYFDINQINNEFCHVTTETRALCLGEKALIKFRPYWYLIRPVSGFIRHRILLIIQKNVKKENNISQL